MTFDAAYSDLPTVEFPPAALEPCAKSERLRRVLDGEKKVEDPWSAALLRIRREKDSAAFAELFAHFAPRVKAFLMKSGASEAQAEDSMQEAMAAVWHKAALFDPTRATAATWIFTIARNKQLDAIRKLSRPEPEDLPWEPSTEPDPLDAAETAQDQQRLAEAVSRLPARQRAMIEKAFFGDLSHREIGEITGLPLGTVKSRIRHALERLRHELKVRER